ncbi:hypothetical protein XM38_011780 [Halomicronema hongdechloris C2206]|uniref:CBS domain-containing protein n=1 Tax=Halomicronema hongdechloris C2206 TaxID=1641165 RepID=A0A1Z3HIU7_9CYAN|nr:CBS domain-containing protein [Halomicronema hongdechloris]ASC70242.1 hypothetical protein XM38_011780 [Halomicronema hongdechloris C2206]
MATSAPHLTPIVDGSIDRDPLMVGPTTSLIEVLALMSQTLSVQQQGVSQALISPGSRDRSSSVLVVENHRLMGIFTERDLVKLVAAQHSLAGVEVGQVMSSEVVVVAVEQLTDIFVPLDLMRRHHIRHLPVVDADYHPLGLITQRKLLQTLKPGTLLRFRPVADVMTPDVVQGPPTMTLLQVARLMRDRLVSCVVITAPVTQGINREPSAARTVGRTPVGIITERDLVQVKALEFDFEQIQAQVVMSTPLFLVRPEEMLLKAQTLMRERRLRRLVVADGDGQLRGILTQSSLLRVLTPGKLYNTVSQLEQRLVRLEAEKKALTVNQNAELEHQLEDQSHCLEQHLSYSNFLEQLSHQVWAATDLITLFKWAMADLNRLLRANRMLTYQFATANTGLVIAEAIQGPWTKLIGRFVEDPCFDEEVGDFYRQGHCRAIQDIYDIHLSDCHRSLLELLEVKAYIVVPLVVPVNPMAPPDGQMLWGLLMAQQCDSARAWDALELSLLRQVAILLAIAVQKLALMYKRPPQPIDANHPLVTATSLPAIALACSLE